MWLGGSGGQAVCMRGEHTPLKDGERLGVWVCLIIVSVVL